MIIQKTDEWTRPPHPEETLKIIFLNAKFIFKNYFIPSESFKRLQIDKQDSIKAENSDKLS